MTIKELNLYNNSRPIFCYVIVEVIFFNQNITDIKKANDIFNMIKYRKI